MVCNMISIWQGSDPCRWGCGRLQQRLISRSLSIVPAESERSMPLMHQVHFYPDAHRASFRFILVTDIPPCNLANHPLTPYLHLRWVLPSLHSRSWKYSLDDCLLSFEKDNTTTKYLVEDLDFEVVDYREIHFTTHLFQVKPRLIEVFETTCNRPIHSKSNRPLHILRT